MFLSKRSNGYYYVYYKKADGKKTCISTKTKIKSEALKFLTGFNNELKKRKLNGVIRKSLKEFSFDFLKYSESFHRPKTTLQFKTIFKQFFHHCGDLLLPEIGTALVEDYLQKKTQVSLYTAQKHLAYLRSAFNKAQRDKYIYDNPFCSVKNYKLPERQPLFFDESAFHILLRVVDDLDFRDIIIFAVNTGLREMELITLTWYQINLKENYLILDNLSNTTKSKKVRTIPLNIEAMQILVEREKKHNSELVFTFSGEKFNPEVLSKRFKKYVIEAKLNPKLKFHSLRHTFASWLVQRGVSLLAVSKLLGHSDISVTEIYSHLRAEDLRKAVDVLSN